MPGVHLNEQLRVCGAATVVEGQENVWANDRLVAVAEDPNSHGAGNLMAPFDTFLSRAVYINNKKVMNNSPDEAEADSLCPLPPHCAPSVAEGSEDVFCGGGSEGSGSSSGSGTGSGTPGGSTGYGGGGGTGNVSFSFTQTWMPCASCGWLFTSSKLDVTGSAGSVSASAPGFLVKVGRGTPTVKFNIPKSSVGTVTSARLYLVFHTGEGIANSDYSSIVNIYGNGVHIATYTAGQVKGLGYSKSNPNFNFDVTSFVKTAV